MKKINNCKSPEEMIEILRMRRMQKTKYKMRIRTLLFLCSLSVILLVITVCAKNVRADSPALYKTVIIEQGDTLWDLARKYYPEKEVRSAIYELKKVNEMDTSNLYEGQALKVPDIFDNMSKE